MLNIVIFGAPGSGKGTQSEKIVEKMCIRDRFTALSNGHIESGIFLKHVLASWACKYPHPMKDKIKNALSLSLIHI